MRMKGQHWVAPTSTASNHTDSIYGRLTRKAQSIAASIPTMKQKRTVAHATVPRVRDNVFFFTQHAVIKARKASSAKGEKRQKRIITPKFVQTKAFPESALCTSLRVAVQSWKSNYHAEKHYATQKPTRNHHFSLQFITVNKRNSARK